MTVKALQIDKDKPDNRILTYRIKRCPCCDSIIEEEVVKIEHIWTKKENGRLD